MPRDGSGNYTLPSGNPVVTGTTISSTTHNNTNNDLASALTASVAKDGQTTPTANLPMGTFRHINVGNASARNHYAATGQVQDNAFNVLSSVAGTNSITGSLTPQITAYSAGMLIAFTPANTNTGATTISISGLTALDIFKEDGDALAAGDLVVGVPAFLILDSGADDFYLLNPQTFATLTVSGNATIGGTLGVTGVATLGGIAHTDFARLSQANTFTALAGGLASPSMLISSARASFSLNETDGAANNRLWTLEANSEQLNWYVVNDAGSTAAAFLTVERTGTTIDSANLQATSVQVNGVSIRDASILNAGSISDARVPASNVTQHQAALSIATSQLTGNMPDARIVLSNVTQHQASLAINAEQLVTGVTSSSSTSYSTASGDEEDVVYLTSASAVTVTLNGGIIPTGASIAFIRYGTGTVTFAAGASQTIRSPGSRLAIPEQYGTAVATYIATNEWAVAGV